MRELLSGLALIGACLPGVALAQASDDVQVAVLGAAVARGDRLDLGDFVMDTRPAGVARGALGPAAVIGMEAIRNLPAGTVVRAGDIGPPQLVRRGEPVTVRYVEGALIITGAGRALGNGGQSDAVRVVLTATSRTLDTIVEGQGTVRLVAP